MKVKVFKPPHYPHIEGKSLFLGGSIEMGKVDNWQETFTKNFINFRPDGHRGWLFCNPRRDDWDTSWKQSIDNAQFFQQVNWEMTYLNRCSHRLFYFAGETLSPITLLELGTFHQLPNTFVCADPKYLRRGNVEVFCHMKEIKLYHSLDQIMELL